MKKYIFKKIILSNYKYKKNNNSKVMNNLKRNLRNENE